MAWLSGRQDARNTSHTIAVDAGRGQPGFAPAIRRLGTIAQGFAAITGIRSTACGVDFHAEARPGFSIEN